MAETITTSGRLDEKGRVIVPANIRKAMGVEPGDTIFLRYEPREKQVYIAPPENSCDALAEQAIEEYQAGQTRIIDKFTLSHKLRADKTGRFVKPKIKTVINPDFDWFQKNYRQLKSAYLNQWVVICNQDVMSHGNTFNEAISSARDKGIERPFITRVCPEGWEG